MSDSLRPRLLVLLLVAAATGCEKDELSAGQPWLTLDPEPGLLTWGQIAGGSTTEPKFVQIGNAGTGPLSIIDLLIDGADAPLFAPSTSPLPLEDWHIVMPGDEATLRLDLTAPRLTAQVRAELSLVTDDPDRPLVTYPLSATLRPRCSVRAVPSEVSTRLGEPVALSVVVAGNAPCRLVNVVADARYFRLTRPLTDALTLQPGQTWFTSVVQTRTDVPTDARTVEFQTHEGPGARTVLRPDTTPGLTDCITLEPLQAIFPGPVLLGRESARTVLIGNRCDGAVALHGVTSGSPSFIVHEDLPDALAGRSQLPVTITFAPEMSGEYRTRLTVASADPARPQVVSQLVAVAEEEAVYVRPAGIAFSRAPYRPDADDVSVCGSAVRSLSVYNGTSRTVAVEDIGIAGDERFVLLGATIDQTPVSLHGLRLPPRTEAMLDLRFFPSRLLPALHAAELSGTFDGQALTVSLEGKTAEDAVQEERFVQSGTSRTDVLFVVDQSGSMREERARLERNLGAFLEQAARADADLRIGLTTADARGADGGRLHSCVPHPGYVDPSYADAETRALALRCALNTLPAGTPVEAGLDAARRAIERGLEPAGSSSDPNAGFIRDDANLAVIVVSDEDDQSFVTDQAFAAAVTGPKEGREGLSSKLYAIVGMPGDDTCIDAQPAPRYARMVEALDGQIHSICSEDWHPILEMLGRLVVATRDRFPLSDRADPLTLAVTVDGRPIDPSPNDGFTYDRAQNNVVLHGAARADIGAEVIVRYEIACDP